jgi:galactose oxidase-like protein/Kelch motif protein
MATSSAGTGGLLPEGGGPATIDASSAEIFDPAAGTFTPTGSMTVPRFNHSALCLNNGRVLVLGGNGLRSAEVYHPASGTFSPVADMEVAHGLGHRTVKLLDGKVLVLGGDSTVNGTPSAVAEVFDPATNQFTRIADMTTTRELHFAVLIEDDGTVLIGGGQDASGDVLASAELYDPTNGSFTPVADMPLPGSEQAAVYVPE